MLHAGGVEAEGLRRILVAGSLSREQSTEHEKSFASTCFELGQTIGRSGCELLIGSLQAETADRHALAGYLDAGGQAPFLMVREGANERPRKAWDQLTSRCQGARFELLPAADPTAWRLHQVRLADGAVLVGGKAGTATIRRICRVRARCCVGLPNYAGPGRDAHSDLLLLARGRFQALHELAADLGAHPAHAVELLQRMWHARADLFAPCLVPDDTDSHAFRALALAARATPDHVVAGPALLRAMLQVRVGGKAFGQLRSLFGSAELSLPSGGVDDPGPDSPALVTLEPRLMESLRIAWAAVPARDKIWGRTLVTAALFDQSLADDPEYGVKAPALREQWRAFLLADEERAQVRGWLEALAELESRWSRPPAPGDAATAPPQSETTGTPPSTAFGIPVATPGNDDPWSGGKDQLKVEDEAKAFARVAASNAFKPPLAVGVFGDWGAGKSFFMRLVYEHVERLAAGSRSPDAPEAGDELFHKDVVQVRFNAWHYAETNLWASLVDHLFMELDRWLRLRQVKGGAEPLLERLSTARELTLSAAEELVRRRKEQHDATARVQAAELALERARGPAGRSPSVIWAALRAAVAGDTRLEEVEEQFQAAARKLGIYDAKHSAETLESAARALENELARAEVMRKNLLERLQSPLLVFVFVLACLAAPFALSFARGALAKLLPELNTVPEGVLGVSALLTSAAGILGTVAARVRSALTQLQRSKEKLDEAIERQLEAPNQGLKDEQAKLRKLSAEAEEARARLSSSTTRLAEATREYASGTGSGRLMDFIRARATDGQYARHLGLIATIRKDFEELASNLNGASDAAQEELRKSLAAFRARIDSMIAASGELLSADEQTKLRASTDQGPPLVTFQRIILYIDDLDRCDPDKVVDVLQALHLLLTFPLFVVFVAVDVRWVSRSLEKKYGDLLDPLDRNERAGPTATAQDYLEKIFQVPYWVRPMLDTASQDFMRGRTEGLLDLSLPAPLHQPAEAHSTPAVSGGLTQASDSTESSPQHHPARLPAPALERTPPPPDNTSQRGPHPTGEAPAVRATTNGELTAADARALRLSEGERDRLVELAPHLGASPRRALRFLNTYHVVKAGMTDADITRLSAGGYRALMTQLAIATGAPNWLDGWLCELAKGGDRSLDAILEAVKTPPKGELERVRLEGALATYADDLTGLRTYAPVAKRYTFSG